MKPALLEVMRMNRICRMALATCLGSFILVIFYFQSMLHPGRGRVSVVLLDIFFSLALSLGRSAWLLCLSTLTSSPSATSGPLAARFGRATASGWEGGGKMCSLLGFLPAPGWRMGPGGAVVFFLCVSCLSVCEVAGKGRGCGKLLGSGGRFEESETSSPFRPKSEDERGAGSRPRYARARCPFPVGVPGAKGAGSGEVESPCREPWSPRPGSTCPGLGAAPSRCGERVGARPGAAPPPGRGRGLALAVCPRGPDPH